MREKSERPIASSKRLEGVGTAALAFVLFWLWCVALGQGFLRDIRSPGYLESTRRMEEMASNGPTRLRHLIQQNEVTWDPTNGAEIERVLTHLKSSSGEQILMVGSSQLITVLDDLTPRAFEGRVDKILERLTAMRVTVTNLSMGGMTLPEKRIIIEKAWNLVPYEQVVAAMTLWDSTSDYVRPSIQALPPRLGLATRPAGWWHSPGEINFAVGRFLTRLLGSHLIVVGRRSAVQYWFEDRALGWFARDSGTDVATAPPPAASTDGAKPVQYEYRDPLEQARILTNVDAFLDFLGLLAAQKNRRAAILLTPFRQDPRFPAYLPEEFYERYVDRMRTRCRQLGLTLIDASTLLGAEHFRLYAFGSDLGKIDVLHVDRAGHQTLAEWIGGRLGLLPTDPQ